MKGIILAGGSGSRLFPLTKGVNKQLLPVHDKPLIYYPLTTLITAGIREICVISAPSEISSFKELLGSGEQFGVEIDYRVQAKPEGVPQAFSIASDFIDGPVALILGDNIFVDSGEIRRMVGTFKGGARVLGYQVSDPSRFGVLEFDRFGEPVGITEKPKHPKSKTVVPGFYVYDEQILEIASVLKPSKRGELEITDVNMTYLKGGQLEVHDLSRGSVWIDAGTSEALSRATRYISTIEEHHGLKIGCPEEASFRRGFVSSQQLMVIAKSMPECSYKNYLIASTQGRRVGSQFGEQHFKLVV